MSARKVTEEKYVVESNKIQVSQCVDVLVAGGGPAGISAALSSAREGARTLLVERFGYLGGMITGAEVVAVLDVGKTTETKAQGLVEEFYRHLSDLGGITRKRGNDFWVDIEIFKWQSAEMLMRAGADILLHTLVCAPIIDQGRIKGVFTESKNGRQAILAKTVVDCTADADLAYRAGCVALNQTHDVTLTVHLSGIDKQKEALFEAEHPAQYLDIIKNARELNDGFPPQRRLLKNIDVADARELTKAEILLRHDCFATVDYLRKSLRGWETATVKCTAPQLGVRQSRLISGRYTLSIEDIEANRHFDDTIGRLGEGYDIPYRCLLPNAIDGLLVAGRCISCDYDAANVLRIITPCIVTGQAAGIAAALSSKLNVAPAALPYPVLREVLCKQNVYLGNGYSEEIAKHDVLDSKQRS